MNAAPDILEKNRAAYNITQSLLSVRRIIYTVPNLLVVKYLIFVMRSKCYNIVAKCDAFLPQLMITFSLDHSHGPHTA